MLKFQAVAEKTAKNFRGLLFLPHPVDNTKVADMGLLHKHLGHWSASKSCITWTLLLLSRTDDYCVFVVVSFTL